MVVIKSGLHGFDKLAGGGFIKNRIYMVAGPPGAGKTTFAIQFLVGGTKQNECGLFISLSEEPRLIIEDMSNYNFNIKKLVDNKMLLFVDIASTTYLQQFRSVNPSDLLDKISEIKEKLNIQRIVIDSMSLVRYATNSSEHEKIAMIKFFRKLKEFECTFLLISDLSEMEKYTYEHYLVHGLILLNHYLEENEMKRKIAVIKMRGLNHDNKMRNFLINSDGLKIL